MLLLVIGVLAVSWLLWSVRDDRRDAEEAALEGVAQELKLNLQRMLSELMALTGGTAYVTGSLMEVRHPQLDAVHSGLVLCDRRAISVMGAMYQELQARKIYLQAALEAGQATEEDYDNALYAAIDGIVTLYLWEEHKGCKPPEARSTRSWDVRKWMKANGFGQFSFPDVHLRDAVVDRLRQYGMKLTPAPLEFSAFEYWSMRYDRKKDLGAAGYRRAKKEQAKAEAEEEPFAPEDEHVEEVEVEAEVEVAQAEAEAEAGVDIELDGDTGAHDERFAQDKADRFGDELAKLAREGDEPNFG